VRTSVELTEVDVEALECVADAQVAYNDGNGPTRLVRGRAFVNRRTLGSLERRGLLVRRRAAWGSGAVVDVTAEGLRVLMVAQAKERMRLADERLAAEMAESETADA
jgi:hypothetical protein